MTILDWRGNTCNLSDKVYRITKGFNQDNYRTGDLVRLISGVDGNKRPGYHFMPGWVTVCSVKVNQAQFLGLRNDEIEEVTDEISN